MSVRVEALANREYSYSAKRMDGSSVDELNWGFRWYILNQSTDEEYGTLMEPTNTSYVTVVWKAPTNDNVDVIRILACDVLIKDSNGNETCQQVVRIEVVVTTNVTDLGLTIDGIEGYTTAYTGYIDDNSETDINVVGPVKLLNQCHIQGNDLVFYSQGSTGVTNFIWEVASWGQNTNSLRSGYFVDDDGISEGNPITKLADGSYQSEVNVREIGPPPNPPANGSHYVKVLGLDDDENTSGVSYIKFKVVPEDPYITSNSYVNEIEYVPGSMDSNYDPIYFSWILHNMHHYPEWFKMKAYLEIGELYCPSGPCVGLTATDFTGTYWNSGTMVTILDDYIYNLKNQMNVSKQFEFGYTVPIPGFFGTGWVVGDSDEYRVCLHVDFEDEDYGPTSCIVEKDVDCQDVKILYCPQAPSALDIKLIGPTCPTGLPGTTMTFIEVPGVSIGCPEGYVWDSINEICATGCTMGMVDDGDGGCACPTGQEMGYTGGQTMCVPTGDCPTGTIRVGDYCIACVEPISYDVITEPVCPIYCVEVYPISLSVPCWGWTWEYVLLTDYWKYITSTSTTYYYSYTNTNLPTVVIAPDVVYYSPVANKLLDTTGVKPIEKDTVVIGGNTYTTSQFVGVVGPGA